MVSRVDLPNKFYVYEYLNEDGTPYYIGRGSKRRAWMFHKNIMVPDDKSKIHIIVDNLDEEESCLLEIHMISSYGRKDIGTGILENKSDGSESLAYLRAKEKTISEGKKWLDGAGRPKTIKLELISLVKKFSKEEKLSVRKIADQLAQLGFYDSNGRKFGPGSIQYMLKYNI